MEAAKLLFLWASSPEAIASVALKAVGRLNCVDANLFTVISRIGFKVFLPSI